MTDERIGPPVGVALERSELTGRLAERWEQVLNNPLYNVLLTTAVGTDGLAEVGLYGGMPLFLAAADDRNYRKYVDEWGGEYRLAENRCGDLDLMAHGVADNVDLIGQRYEAALLAHFEGDSTKFEIKKIQNNIAGYARIEVCVGGRQIMSLGDLKAVADHTKMIGTAIWGDGYCPPTDDWEEVMRVGQLKNMRIFLMEKDAERVEQISRKDAGVGGMIEVNDHLIDTVAMCELLREKGRADLVPSLLSGMATRAGMLAAMPVEGERGLMFEQGEGGVTDQIMAEMKYIGSLAEPEKRVAQKYLAARVIKGMAVDGADMARNWMVLGIGYAFSAHLGGEVEKYWRCLGARLDMARTTMLAWENEPGVEALKSAGGYVMALAAGMGVAADDFDQIMDEFSRGWPKDGLKETMVWGGSRGGLSKEIDSEVLKRGYREWKRDGGVGDVGGLTSFTEIYGRISAGVAGLALRLTKE